MVIVESATGQRITVAISPVEAKDFRQITNRRYSFDWKRERGIAEIFKLSLAGEKDILGLVSIMDFSSELRIQIRLICASSENIGQGKRYRGIVGCLIAFVGRRALKMYGDLACVSLLPKTELRAHYKREYGMKDGGPQLYLDGAELQAVVNKYLS